MRGDPEVLTTLNELLTAELTSINQYWVHYRMCENWGYARLAAKKRGESMEEMKHADALVARILFLDGVPNLQRLNPVKVGESVLEQHRVDLESERGQAERLNRGIDLCCGKGDDGSRKLLTGLLEETEESIDWLEAQLHVIEEIGIERYLAEQIHE